VKPSLWSITANGERYCCQSLHVWRTAGTTHGYVVSSLSYLVNWFIRALQPSPPATGLKMAWRLYFYAFVVAVFVGDSICCVWPHFIAILQDCALFYFYPPHNNTQAMPMRCSRHRLYQYRDAWIDKYDTSMNYSVYEFLPWRETTASVVYLFWWIISRTLKSTFMPACVFWGLPPAIPTAPQQREIQRWNMNIMSVSSFVVDIGVAADKTVADGNRIIRLLATYRSGADVSCAEWVGEAETSSINHTAPVAWW